MAIGMATKRAFIFSFGALFISIIIFSYAQLSLSQNTYTQDLTFKESRILFLNDEVKYFKEIYVVDSLKFSMYNALDVLLNHANSTGYSLNGNHSRLNQGLLQLIRNGSINGIDKPDMENQTFSYFLGRFQDTFESSYRGNINATLDKINVFQTDPYYLRFQADFSFSVETQDNISGWNDSHTAIASIPIIELRDPMFLLTDDITRTLRPAERYLLSTQWDLEKLNITINNTYSTVYVDPQFKYAIGDSYLDRFIDRSESTYDRTSAFLSFDYDEENRSMVDTSQETDPRHYGNTELLFTFDNETTGAGQIRDHSDYDNDGQLINGPDCGDTGIAKEACHFDGSSQGIEVTSMSFPENLTEFSFSFWVNPDSTNPADDHASLLRMSDTTYTPSGSKDGFAFRYDGTTSDIDFLVGDTSDFALTSLTNVTAGEWTHIVGTFDEGNLSLFRNGDLVSQESTSIDNIRFLTDTLDIAKWNTQDYFAGSLDELTLHSKALTGDEVFRFYVNRRAELIDYRDSYHGSSLRFDGVNDYVNITGDSLDVDSFKKDWSVETWFVPMERNRTQYVFIKQHPVQLMIKGDDALEAGIRAGGSWVREELESNISLGKNYYVVITWDEASRQMRAYLDGEKVAETTTPDITSSMNHSFALGANNLPSLPLRGFFKGRIDEFRVVNETLSPEEIRNHYLNFHGYVKGCCGYLTPINPAAMGYDSTAYRKNISYSARTFYGYHFEGRPHQNVTLYEITNISSRSPSEPHYNLKFDYCLMRAYQVFNYDRNPTLFAGRNGTNTCEELIKEGYY